MLVIMLIIRLFFCFNSDSWQVYVYWSHKGAFAWK